MMVRPQRWAGRTAAIAAVIGICLLTGPTRAQEAEDLKWSDWAFLGMAIVYGGFLVADVSMLAGGTVYAIGNGTYVADPDKASPEGWRKGGYIFAGINLTAGAGWLAASFKDGEVGKLELGLGVAHLIVGLSDLGLTIAGSKEPEPGTPQVTLQPLVMADRRGNPAFGAGVAVVGW